MQNLSGPERPALSGTTKQLVVLLHGYGSDGNDLIGLAPLFAEALPDAHFISPNAVQPCEMGPFGYQWFSLQNWSPATMHAGAKSAAPYVQAFLDTQLNRFNLKDENLALVGFSQGTMMSLYCSLRREKPIAGVLGYSGTLLGVEAMGDEVKSRPHVCLIHGTTDTVVPFDALAYTESALELHDVPVEAHARPGLAHGIDEKGLEIGISFLRKRFA